MFFGRILFLLLFLHLGNLQIQINLYLTNPVGEDENLQHDCLYILVSTNYEFEPQQIVSYCMSELSSKFKIKENNIDQKFTFAELSEQNITSQQLYLWSAPIDIVEQYQDYLNQSKTSENTKLSTEIYYNCTLPYFGSKCQYVLNAYKSYYSSLDEIIHDYYSYNIYVPTLFTCYIHLECNRGPSPSCLDWSEICDGKVDCLDNEYDEEYCWQIATQECNENEFQCKNGQCITKSFVDDDRFNYDCLDGTDEDSKSYSTFFGEPSFRNDDNTCAGIRLHTVNSYSMGSCTKERDNLYLQAIFSIKPNSLSHECWTAMKCIMEVPISQGTICRELCADETCNKIIQETCPDKILVPAVPILFGHVYVAYEKQLAKILNSGRTWPQYACYNPQVLQLFTDNTYFLLDNTTACSSPLYTGYKYIMEYNEWDYFITETHKLLWHYQPLFSSNNSAICNHSNIYQCINSSKCIPITRLFDTIDDCVNKDDEIFNNSYAAISRLDYSCSSKQFSNYFKCMRTNEYVPRSGIKNLVCDCPKSADGYCEDEDPDIAEFRTIVLFQTLCNGFIHLLPQIIEGQNETDETNCEQWPLIHIYNRCDGIWDVANGSDELNCDFSSLLNCPTNNYICISYETKKIICLSIEKLCNGFIDCFDQEDERVCANNNITSPRSLLEICRDLGGLYDYDITTEVNANYYHYCTRQKVYFTLDQSQKFVKQNIKHEDTHISRYIPDMKDMQHYQPRCHRGLDVEVWLDKEKNLTTNACLCPPSYYSDICQYQNQRISLTLQFRAISDSVKIPFIIIILLIDDSNERIIHSSEQITYFSIKHCQKKYNIYLLYSSRPKDQRKEYFIHIDIYEKITLEYRGSIIKSLNYSFLPVHRLGFQMNIPRSRNNLQICTDKQCIHGKCIEYTNDSTNRTFCQCYKGWSGRYCTIRYNCTCSSDSLCIGKLVNNRSLCVCPLNKIGSRCLINNTICQNNIYTTCLNKGRCVPLNEYGKLEKKFTCICQNGFTGDQCEIRSTQLIMKFDKNIIVPSTIFIHFFAVMHRNHPIRTTTFKTIPFVENSIIIYWSLPFHILFIELLNKTYYLGFLQKIYNPSSIIETTINSSNQCLHINELFNETIRKFVYLRRIKFYHLPCQSKSLELKCFYDEQQLCLCQDLNQERVSNCFEFDHHMNLNCSGQSGCLNGGKCYQENINCPRISMCQCLDCYFGRICQLDTNGYSLSLDAILGYHIQPNIRISQQPSAVLISLILSLVIALAGLINSILSLITFKNRNTRKSGCGLYLLTSSIITLLIIIIFLLKFLILLFTQMRLIKNLLFLKIQCYSIDFLLRFSLTMDQWLTAFVAIERAFIIIKTVNFNQNKSKLIAKWTIMGLILISIVTNIHDPIYRNLFEEKDVDDNDDDADGNAKRIWCIVNYPSAIRIINFIINILHFIIPFIINLISAIIIIIMSTRQQIALQNQQKYSHILKEQIEKHKNLLIGPSVLIILGIPRLIISLTSGCMKSSNDFWLFLLGYYISLIPSLLTFILFVLPSTTYKQAFKEAISQYRNIIKRHSET